MYQRTGLLSLFLTANLFAADCAKQLAREIAEHLRDFEPLSVALQNELSDSLFAYPDVFNVARNRWLSAYAKIAKQLKRTPTKEEFCKEAQVSDESLDQILGKGKLFRDFSQFIREAKEKHPSQFVRVIDTSIFDSERDESLLQAVRASHRLIVVTAMAGAPVNQSFLKALLQYCAKEKAEIIVIPTDGKYEGLDPILLETPKVHVLAQSLELSPRWRLNTTEVKPEIRYPLQGMETFGKRGQSQVFASPKLHVKVIPTIDNFVHPHFLMTTASITFPNYSKNRSGSLAKEQHMLGALLLEKSSPSHYPPIPEQRGEFHPRHIEWNEAHQGFFDIDRWYTPKGSKKMRPFAIVPGDLHLGVTDPKLMHPFRRQILSLGAKALILQDPLDNKDINPHERGNLLSRGRRAQKGEPKLEREVKNLATFINSVMSFSPTLEIFIDVDNHGGWLPKWLQSGAFMSEPQNQGIGLKLAQAVVEGKNPIETALLMAGIEFPKRLHVMDAGKGLNLGTSIEFSRHGHAGANGSNGSLLQFERSADRIIYGHTHTYERRNSAMTVGTFTAEQDYMKEGISNWVQAVSIVGPNDEIQVLCFQDGEWFSQSEPVSEFFLPGYPSFSK